MRAMNIMFVVCWEWKAVMSALPWHNELIVWDSFTTALLAVIAIDVQSCVLSTSYS